MTSLVLRALAISALAAVPAAVAFEPNIAKDKPKKREAVRIGIAANLLPEASKPLIESMMGPFKTLISTQTGMKCDVTAGDGAEKLRLELLAGKLDIVVIPGVEFAWLRQKHPQLRAMMIVANQKDVLRAYVVVRADHEACGIGDLKGKTMSVPKYGPAHCFLFLESHCTKCAKADSKAFFSKVISSTNSEDALDDVVDGETAATLVEEIALESYQRRKPVRYSRLRILQQSESFPATVIAYREGGLDGDTIAGFRKSLLEADKTPFARQLMVLWRMTAFRPLPQDYDATLTNIVKCYPPPGDKKLDVSAK